MNKSLLTGKGSSTWKRTVTFVKGFVTGVTNHTEAITKCQLGSSPYLAVFAHKWLTRLRPQVATWAQSHRE